MKRILLFSALLAVSGCTCNSDDTVERTIHNTNEKHYKAEVLFTDADGYTVKRFKDGEYYRYYVTPGPSMVQSVIPEQHTTMGVDGNGNPTTTTETIIKPETIQTTGEKKK